MRVTAFPSDDGCGSAGLGYRVEHGGEAAVITGRARPSASLIAAVAAADLLVYAPWLADPGDHEPSRARLIAAAEDAGRMFAKVGPGLAVVYHWHDDGTLEEGVRRSYSGPLIIGSDRMASKSVDETRQA